MADSFNKKDREKKRRKRKEQKAEKREQRKKDGAGGNQLMYMDEFGNFTTTPPELQNRTEISAESIDISVPKKEDIEEEDGVRNGKVKFFNTEKGYGFIIDEVTGDSYFTHISNVIDDAELRENDKVSFILGNGPKGPVAEEVRLR